MTPDDAEEFTQIASIIGEGWWRTVALGQRLDVPAALGLTLHDWRLRVVGGMRVAITERVEAAKELAAEGMSTRDIGDVLGYSAPTISRDLRPVSNETTDEVEVEVEGPSPVSNETPTRAHVTHNSGEHEWYTPAEYVEAARTVMGGIDLDPASSPEANEVVQAGRYYTADDDGLRRPWKGRVWLNPPYSSDLIGKFCPRLARSFVSGQVEEACVLVNNATETSWFQALADVATAFCFPRGRVRFWYPGRQSFTPLQGQAVLYLGTSPDTFRAEFVRFGFVGRVSS